MVGTARSLVEACSVVSATVNIAGGHAREECQKLESRSDILLKYEMKVIIGRYHNIHIVRQTPKSHPKIPST
jgi:hypothetical protein